MLELGNDGTAGSSEDEGGDNCTEVRYFSAPDGEPLQASNGGSEEADHVNNRSKKRIEIGTLV